MLNTFGPGPKGVMWEICKWYSNVIINKKKILHGDKHMGVPQLKEQELMYPYAAFVLLVFYFHSKTSIITK